MTPQPTLQEVRKAQDEQLDRLRKLQRDKPLAPLEQQERFQKEIDAIIQEIRNLDTIIQGLLKPPPK
jgi:vacuolar-type H+-ATPase subunit I/STV1